MQFLLLLIVLFLAAFLAFVLSAVCGGGASFILLPLLGWFLPVAQVPAALSIGSFTSSLSRIAVFKRCIRWDIVAYFVPAALPAVWLGARFITMVNPLFMQLAIGAFLIINLPLLFKPAKTEAAEAMKSSKFMIALIGFATGFLSGLTGAVGLLFNRFYLTQGLSKEQIIATRAANELLLHIVKVVLYSFFGLVTLKSLSIGLVIALAAVVSSLLMRPVLKLISEPVFRKVGLTAMVGFGFFTLFNSANILHEKENLDLGIAKLDKGFETKLKFRDYGYSLEFEYDEGFETERAVKLSEMPKHLQQKVIELGKNADRIFLEEVYGFGKHYFEVYLYQGDKLIKHDLQ